MKIRRLVLFCVLSMVVGLSDLTFAETEYFALFMDGKKIGYTIHSRVVSGDKVTTTEKVNMTISRMNVPMTIKMTDTSIETTDGKPLGFESVQDLSMMKMKMAGTVDKQGTIHLTMTMNGGEQKSSYPWPAGSVMSEGLRLLQMKKGLKEGVNYTTKLFSPAMQMAVPLEITIGKKKNIDLLGRVVTLTEVTTITRSPMSGEIIETSYVDSDLRVQKSIMPMAGIKIEMIACAKEFALGENDVFEIVEKMFLPSPEPLENVSSAASITYHLSPKAEKSNLIIPATDNQSVEKLKNGNVIVTVKPVSIPAKATFPYKGKDKAILEAMKPTVYLQSDRSEIIALAKKAVGNTKNAVEAVQRIEGFVAEYITNKNLSVGYASAMDVVTSRQGDCTEFSVLTAAMCRAVGIPAQVVFGVAYVKDFYGLQNRFGGHAWVQAYVGGKWIGLDASFKSAGLKGYDPGHIALAVGNGDMKDFFDLAANIGTFKIDKAIINKSP